LANTAATKNRTVRKINKNPKVQDLMRSEIYQAAARAAQQNGFAAISMDDVAREMGGSKGQVYYYFKSKDELLSSMSLYVHEIGAKARLALINDSSLSPEAKLERILREHVLSLCQNWNLHRALWTNTWFASLDQDNFKKVVALRHSYRKAIADLISQINGTKKEKKSVSKLKGIMVVSFVDNVAGWYRPDGPQNAEEIADRVVRAVNAIVAS
jgi:AcrR family transcriptional regulator